MSELETYVTTNGLFPLPDGVKHELRSVKGRQKDDLIDGSEDESIHDIYADARETVFHWQEEAGLDRIVDGQLRWDDMLAHPLAIHESVTIGGLRRYYDNNNFYREITVTDPLTANGDIRTDIDAATDHVPFTDYHAIVPGPISLADLATDEYYGTAEELLEGVAGFLADEIRSFSDIEMLTILEPSLVEERLEHPPEQACAAIDRLATAAQEAGIRETLIHSYWGVPSEETYREVLSIKGVGVGLDLVSARDEALGLLESFGSPSTVALGVVNGQNTRVESVAEIEGAVSEVVSATGAIERAYLVPNTEGFYLPTNRFREKLATLGEASRRMEVEK